MTATISWIVEQMDCYPTAEGETDVVFTVHWRCHGFDGDYVAALYGAEAVTYAAGEPFTPYADLTQDQVIGWIQDAMGPEQVASIEANVEKQIQDQINPPVVSPPLPW